MILKRYQVKVINIIRQFYTEASRQKQIFSQAPDELKEGYNWVQQSLTNIGIPKYLDDPKTGLNNRYPRLCIKVPTGGGKTLLAVESIREYLELFGKQKTGLVVWIVPSETIYSQTLKHLKDKSGHYRQLIDQASSGKTIIAEKGQIITKTDVENNLVILFIMIQSVNRKNAKESLKVFEDSGYYDSFFPRDNRYDLHRKLLEQVPNLDSFAGVDSTLPQVKTSLGNIIRLTNPLLIIDEFHKVFTDQAKETIDNLNPSMILGLSATPKTGTNILVSISGQELKDEEMVKLDMHLKPPTTNEDWQTMVKEIKEWRENLEEKANDYKREKGRYIRPIALLQAERTGKEQRGKGFVHSEDIRDTLIELGVPAHEIAIKTSSQNDIEEVNLLSQDCEIRYIITKEALKEGWDCPFAYILGIIPNVNSNQGTTQLVGRILRQPFAQKTEIKELDESYVYFANGHVEKILTQIKSGFKNEGLEDLMNKHIHSSEELTQDYTKTVNIKKEFQDNYYESLFLPLWLIKINDKCFRKFNYDIDIKPNLSFKDFDFEELIIKTIKPSLSKQVIERKGNLITIQDDQIQTTEEVDKVEVNNYVDVHYLARRLQEVVENSFLSFEYAEKIFRLMHKHIEKDIIPQHFGFIVSEIIRNLTNYKTTTESKLFNKLLDNKKLVLSVSQDQDIGFQVPQKDIIPNLQYPNRYHCYLYDDIDTLNLNSLELTVAETLDRQKNILWWFRNKPHSNWYFIQGWKKQKIRPDFIAARKKEDSKLELVYIIESKGEQLLGSEDTEYKKAVFETMNKIEVIPVGELLEINEKYQYHLIREQEAQAKVQELFN